MAINGFRVIVALHREPVRNVKAHIGTVYRAKRVSFMRSSAKQSNALSSMASSCRPSYARIAAWMKSLLAITTATPRLTGSKYDGSATAVTLAFTAIIQRFDCAPHLPHLNKICTTLNLL